MSETQPVAVPAELPRFPVRLPRPLWIGLGAGLLVATALALQFGLPIYRQYAATELVQRKGGLVKTFGRGPTWLRQYLGSQAMRLFDDVLEISVYEDFGDSDLARLTGLPHLEWLSLENTDVTDAGLEQVGKITSLKYLFLNNNRSLTDAGLAHLKGLSNLETLSLDDTQITDDGLHHLNSLDCLSCLSIFRTNVTRAGIADLMRQRPHLHEVNPR